MNEIKTIRVQYDFPIEVLEAIEDALYTQKIPDYLFYFGHYISDLLGEIATEIVPEDIPEQEAPGDE